MEEESVLFKTLEHFQKIQDFVVLLDFSHSAGVKRHSEVEDLWACGTVVTLCIPCKDGHIFNCTVNSVYLNWHVTF